jgi:two-component sensor histidine kinase
VIPTILGGRRYLIENFLDITERKRAEEQVQASLQEKEVLLKEIHHRVKNNLQVISSLLYLRSKNIEDQEALEMFQDSQNRVRSMALVHERLYQSKDLARIDFAEYVRSLTNYLFRSYGVHSNVIQLKVNMDDASLGVDTAVPCGLMLNELISNSLKHAFPDGREGEVRIELRSDNNSEFTLIVSDDGVGFPQDLDFRDAQSLGLQLVNNLVAQLKGTIELDGSGGTAFKITFTEPKYRGRG